MWPSCHGLLQAPGMATSVRIPWENTYSGSSGLHSHFAGIRRVAPTLLTCLGTATLAPHTQSPNACFRITLTSLVGLRSLLAYCIAAALTLLTDVSRDLAVTLRLRIWRRDQLHSRLVRFSRTTITPYISRVTLTPHRHRLWLWHEPAGSRRLPAAARGPHKPNCRRSVVLSTPSRVLLAFVPVTRLLNCASN